MANNSCEFSRALLERALEGNYSFVKPKFFPAPASLLSLCEYPLLSPLLALDKARNHAERS